MGRKQATLADETFAFMKGFALGSIAKKDRYARLLYDTANSVMKDVGGVDLSVFADHPDVEIAAAALARSLERRAHVQDKSERGAYAATHLLILNMMGGLRENLDLVQLANDVAYLYSSQYALLNAPRADTARH